MNEIIGTIGLISILAVVVYGVYIIAKPQKFQTSK